MKTIQLDKFSEELADYPGKTHEQMKKAVKRGLQRSMADLAAASPVDTGLYASSWEFTMDETKAVIGNHAPYAGIIEYGARPHMPPIGPLLAWAKRVLKDPSQPPKYSPEVQKLAKAVQMKIYHYGQAPKHVLENTLPKIIANIKRELIRG